MAIQNLGKQHITAAQQTAIDAALQTILTNLQTVAPNFSANERKLYGSINEQNKLLVNKTKDYHDKQPALQSPDVDWAEFDADLADRVYVDKSLNTLGSILKMMEDFKIAHDYDNYMDSLTDYQYSQYKNNTNTPGFSNKVIELKQFFNRSGAGKAAVTETPNP